MDLGVISLVLLLLAIILGFFRKTNVGLSYPSFLPSSWGALRA